jgi:hypothetical protein
MLKEHQYQDYDQAHSHSCPIVARKCFFTRFKTLNDISDVAVEGGIVSNLLLDCM